ncbi:MAG TPA: amidase family protein [Actinomycetota bacterium]|nr:amidase family protein [Actinomycetota bacterium]
MSSRLRRSLVLTTLLALLLVVSGAAALIGLAANPTKTKVAGIDVDATTIPELQELMDSRRMNSVQLTNFYLRRIRQLNPTLNAVITVSPTALADARAADRARRNGDDRPLLGIPIIVKDNINTTGMPTTAGSWALAGSTPADAFIVKQLKAAGAIIIGKANLSEWANFRSNPSSSGWSGIGGQGNMPYVLDRNPCGSSSGSGVVAAADLAVAAVGTETDGSIVCPSGANGVVGIKPTLGLWSRAGVIPISADQDTAGPMARNVTDAAVLLGAATGVDPNDTATAAQVGNASTDYTQFLDDEALEGARIGVWRAGTYDPALVGSVVEPILDEAIDALEDEGATVIDGTDIDLSATAGEFAALLCEFKTDIATYLQTYVDGTNPVTRQPYPQTLAELIAVNKAHPELEGPWNDLVFELAEDTNGRDAECAAIRADVTPPVQAAIDELMAENDLDAIIALTNGPAWPTNDDPNEGDLDGRFGEFFVGSSGAAAVSGYADITVPTGDIEGLPIGITFIGGRWAEPELIGLAYDYEQATEVREPPTFIPTIGDALFPGVPDAADQLRAQRQQAILDQRDLVVRWR